MRPALSWASAWLLGSASAGMVAAGKAAAAPSFLESAAGGVFGAGFDLEAALEPGAQPKIKSPGLSWSTSRKDKQLFYPPWMEGTWAVTADFIGAYTPLGRRFTSTTTPGFTKASIIAVADVGATPVNFRERYTLSPNEGGVVADRQFNITSSMDAFLNRVGSVKRVEYSPLENPTRYGVTYTTPRRDGDEDMRKAECFINNRLSMLKPAASSDGLETFLCAEFQRQVVQAARQGYVNDYMVALRLEQTADPTVVRGFQRVAAFLQPQDPAYFDVGGQAVAVYDHTLLYSRV
eukprot:jgi/Tetstr1/422064/TSEL_001249.t1